MSIASRITEIEQHLTDDYSVLTLAGADLTNVDKNIVNLKPTWKERLLYFINNGTDIVWNNWDKVTGEGTTITLNNTEEAPMKINLKGNTSQETNLYNGEIEQGTWGQNGAIDSQNRIRTKDYIIVVANTTIPISFSGADEYFALFYNSSKSYIGQSVTWKTSGTDLEVIENASYIRMSFRKSNNSNITPSEITNLQVGSVPNPDYPQDIHVVSGDNTINVEGKNILKLGFSNDNGKLAGLDFTHTDSTFTLSGTASGTYKSLIMENIPKLVKGNTYTISRNTIGLCPRLFITMNFYSSSDTRIFQMRLAGSATSSTATFDSEEEITTVGFIVEGLSSNANYDCTIEVQIEQNTENTSFEAYKGASYPINLGDIELCKIGDYQDRIFKSSGKNLYSGDTALGTISQSDGVTISSSSTVFYTPSYTEILPSTQYTFSFGGTNLAVRLFYYNSNKEYISTDVYSVSGNNFTFTTLSNAKYIRYQFNKAYDIDFQLEKGSSATLYEPYGTGWYLNKQIGKVVLDGSESGWSYPSANRFNLDNIVNDYLKSLNNITYISDNYVAYKQTSANQGFNDLVANVDYGFNFGSGSGNNVRIKDTRYTDLATFKTNLGTNNLLIYYVLATPTYAEITDSTLISQLNALAKSYASQTNISQNNNDLPFIINATALREMA